MQNYDIILDINSLENLQINGWKLYTTDKGYEKYNEKKDKKCTLVSILGNKNKGKSFILSKISNLKIPNGFNSSTKRLSFIFPDNGEDNVTYLDTPGLEDLLSEDDEFVKFETNNENYLNLSEEEKKYVSIKDYISEDEYITQIMKFNRDKQLTNEFIKRFVIHYSNINIYVVNSELDLEEQNCYKYFLKDKINIIIHNLKTFKKIEEVYIYIDDYMLKSLPFRLEKNIFTKFENENKIKNFYNNIYYIQIFDEDVKNMQIIHLIMANENSEAGDYYNESTFYFIKKLIETNLNFVKFNIIENVREFLFEHSEDFFNDPLENLDDLKIIEENENILLKYTGNPYELKECYYDELGNIKFTNLNYKPNYSIYKVKYKDDNGGSIKLIIDVEISGEVDIGEIKNPQIDNKNGQNIITICGTRNIKKKIKKDYEKPTNYIAEYKPSYFNDKNNMFYLRIYIPNEKCVIGALYGRKFFLDKGLYRFIYNIHEKNIIINIEIDDDDDDDSSEDDCL